MMRFLFALLIGACFGSLMVLVQMAWPSALFIGFVFGIVGWFAFPGSDLKGSCLE
jgi:hypothetical protein